MKMQKKQFRIGELAKAIGVEQFVIRFWEKEFKVTGTRSEGGQRFYEAKDVEKFRSIKKLLYEQGFTIAGAKKLLKKDSSLIIGSQKTSLEEAPEKTPSDFKKKLLALRKQLVELQKAFAH